METYQQLKNRHQAEVDAFPFGAAFNRNQFEDMRKKIPLSDGDKYYSLGAGVYVRGKDIPAMEEMFKRHKQEKLEFNKNRKSLQQAIVQELFNYEYCYSENDEPVLAAVGYSMNDFNSDKELQEIYRKAVHKYYSLVRA